MQFVPKQQNLKPDQRVLLDLYGRLDAGSRETLLAFAEFLVQREVPGEVAEDLRVQEPNPIERPERESVVKAIKRLTTTYYMLEKGQLLDQTSALMMSHVLQGRDAVSVIDELEVVFSEHYRRYREGR